MKKKTIQTAKADKILNILCSEGLSYNYASKILRNKDVLINGIRTKENVMTEKGDEVTYFFEEQGINKKYQIVYEDKNIYLIDKQAGIEVEGEDGLAQKLNALAVHRLDRNTQGLIVFAKNREAQASLLKAFKNHAVEKKYLAEVVGPTSFNGEKYTAYLTKDKDASFVKVSDAPMKNSVEIITTFKTLKSNSSSSVVECGLVTGKTHQLRAHLKFLGHAIIGDGKYGKNSDNKKFKTNTQRLYCFYIKFGALDTPLEYLSQKSFKINKNLIKID